MIGIDTSGVSLHKRGYRQMTVKAPITETLASALLMLTPWKKDRILVDPFCGRYLPDRGSYDGGGHSTWNEPSFSG